MYGTSMATNALLCPPAPVTSTGGCCEALRGDRRRELRVCSIPLTASGSSEVRSTGVDHGLARVRRLRLGWSSSMLGDCRSTLLLSPAACAAAEVECDEGGMDGVVGWERGREEEGEGEEEDERGGGGAGEAGVDC